MENPRVSIQTELGEMVLELFPGQAPITVANFLRYVDENRYQGATFYRAVRLDNQAQSPVKIEVIQGGLGMGEHPAKLPPIPLETTAQTGLRHLDGTLSMARLEPDSAHSEFFICIGNQPELDYGGKRNPDGQGFAAFGRVVRGMEVVRQIQQRPTGGDTPPVQGQWILEPVKILSIRRV
ncbi:MAG: peptidylprolyl isomerase [Meiothermus sp.]|uniref:peptidylprolyl isomerase n=1 Tax=Meiothermus sp. TaxID=1955249 RepID=UPI0025D8BA94|nr:peptidylprolyl isomerase [Meiothermus sp.]MCS7067200.1 peptidylprolyl isomerase [Meiothermus sp.]MDW8424731.1 peptidylprolyl isomerase [Meiothermus sp.]